jgi:hypothetical protein
VTAADLAYLAQANAADLAKVGTLEEEMALDAIDVARDDETRSFDTDRKRREWRRSVSKSVQERRQ